MRETECYITSISPGRFAATPAQLPTRALARTRTSQNATGRIIGKLPQPRPKLPGPPRCQEMPVNRCHCCRARRNNTHTRPLLDCRNLPETKSCATSSCQRCRARRNQRRATATAAHAPNERLRRFAQRARGRKIETPQSALPTLLLLAKNQPQRDPLVKAIQLELMYRGMPRRNGALISTNNSTSHAQRTLLEVPAQTAMRTWFVGRLSIPLQRGRAYGRWQRTPPLCAACAKLWEI